MSSQWLSPGGSVFNQLLVMAFLATRDRILNKYMSSLPITSSGISPRYIYRGSLGILYPKISAMSLRTSSQNERIFTHDQNIWEWLVFSCPHCLQQYCCGPNCLLLIWGVIKKNLISLKSPTQLPPSFRDCWCLLGLKYGLLITLRQLDVKFFFPFHFYIHCISSLLLQKTFVQFRDNSWGSLLVRTCQYLNHIIPFQWCFLFDFCLVKES